MVKSYSSERKVGSFKTVTEPNFRKFLEQMIRAGNVVGPRRKENKYVFGDIKKIEDLALNYDTTILPPKKYFYPPKEVLMTYKMGDKVSLKAEIKPEKRVILGVHACDLAAIKILDKVFQVDNPDPYYAARRDGTLVIGYSCKPNENCFCTSYGADDPKGAYDLFVHDMGGSYLVEVGTESGEKFLASYKNLLQDAAAGDLGKLDKKLESWRKEIKKHSNPKGLEKKLNDKYDSPVWQETANKCLGCGACAIACPVCYCFNVFDDVALNLKDGSRSRQWDSCTLEDFALVAEGHNFRKDLATRTKMRYMHKYKGMPEKYGVYGCVGCGRCISACKSGVDASDIVNKLQGE
jgi:sulfhydrogenase subunit beta (sulfur reductase)